MAKLKTASLLIVMTMLFSGITGCGRDNYIKFDGYYSNQQHHNGVPIFFRFYPDGTVTASLPAIANGAIQFTPNQLDKNNTKECTIRGKYVLNKNNVTFRLVDSNGTADFSGEFNKRAITLKSHSNINGKDSVTTYEFMRGNHG